jgi:hypothetical protein
VEFRRASKTSGTPPPAAPRTRMQAAAALGSTGIASCPSQ